MTLYPNPSFHGYIHIWGMWLLVKCMNLLLIVSQVAQWLKNPPANIGDPRDLGLSLRLGRSPKAGNGNPLQYSCLENSMDRGAWRPRVCGVAKSQTRLSTCAHTIISLLYTYANSMCVSKYWYIHSHTYGYIHGPRFFLICIIFNFYWIIIDIQYDVSFRCTT